MSVIAVYLFVFLVPGLIFCALAKVRRGVFVFSFSISFCLLVITQIPLRLLGGTLMQWMALLAVCFAVLLFTAFKLRRREKRRSQDVFCSKRLNIGVLFGAITIVGGFSIYHFLVGAYTEIPSDFWARLGNVSDQFLLIESGIFDSVDNPKKLIDDTAYVAFIHALVAWLFGVSPLDLVGASTLVTSLIFLGVVYSFSLRIQSYIEIPEHQKIVIAIVATVLTVLVFGVSSFSYIRYYAYFPHILNMALMMVALGIFLDVLDRAEKSVYLSILCVLFLLVMWVVNTQEALFTLVLTVSMCIWRGTRSMFDWFSVPKSLIVLFGIASLALGAAFVGIKSIGLNEAALAQQGNPHLFDLGNIIPDLSGWPVANPRLRFWDTLGWFGVFVYVWFIFRWKWFRDQDFVFGAMASPLLTLFNPVFVVLFIHVAGWDPLWRLAYLMPIPIVAATLLVRSWDQIVEIKLTTSSISVKAIVAILIALIFPFQFGTFENETSRVPSLKSVAQHNGAGLWKDAIDYLRDLDEEETFITDSVTNYVLHTATRHQGGSHPKMRWQKHSDPFTGDYRDRLTYYKRDGELIIVNHRDGELSVNGKVSRHWRSDILKVSTLYPAELLEYLLTNPEEFEVIWKKDKIFVFRIKGEGRE